MKERRNQCNHNFNQISALTYIITEYALIEQAHIYKVSQNYFHIFVSLLDMDINRCQGRMKF